MDFCAMRSADAATTLLTVSAVVARDRADWERVQALYGQLIAVITTSEKMDDELAGMLAKSLARTCACYDGEEALFLDHLLEIFEAVDPVAQRGSRSERFHALYYDNRFAQFKRYRKE